MRGIESLGARWRFLKMDLNNKNGGTAAPFFIDGALI